MNLWNASNDTIKLTIHGDDCPESPREWDNVGTIVGWHGRYTIGDEQPSEEPSRWLHEWQRGRKLKDYIILPVHMYEHSVVVLSTSEFSCPWDSGQIGFIYCEREHAEGMGFNWKDDREKIETCLRQEISTYSQYLNGEVYGFEVERLQPCGHWEHDDSCSGFFGSDWNENGMKDHLPADVHPLFEELT